MILFNTRAPARLCAGASLTVLILAAATGQGAAADGPGRDASNTVGEVVVTAQFREQNLQQTPIAITAVNAQMLADRSQTNIAEVAGQAPNVTLKRQGLAFGPSLAASIRGIGQYDFNPALEPGVGMYVDDVYYSTLTGSVLDLLDLDRVEILRGPQGTLSGKNSIGGAIKLYSKKPDAVEGGYLQATYGGLNRLEARGAADFVVVPEKLFVRLSAVTKHYDGYVKELDYACANPGSGLPSLASNTNCKLGEEGGVSYSAVRTAVRWLATDRIEVNLAADYTSDTSEAPASTLLYASNANPNVRLSPTGVPYDSRFIPADPYANYATFQMTGGRTFPLATPPYPAGSTFTTEPLTASNKSLYRGWGVSAIIDWKLADRLSLKSITAFRGYTSDWGEDNDLSPLQVALGVEHLAHHQLSQEIRLNGSLFGDVVDYTVGGFYFRHKSDYATHQDLIWSAPNYDFLGVNPTLAHTKAGFAHAAWHITDKLNLTGGVRYTDEDKTTSYYRLNRDGTPTSNLALLPLNGVAGAYSGTRWDYRVDVDYRWTPSLMTYAEVSTGFKGGGVNPRPFFASQVQPFGPETLNAYEVGLKSSLFDRRMRLNLSAFYNEYNNIILTFLTCPQFSPTATAPCALPANAGDGIMKGAEAETEIHPLAGLTVDGSVSYLDFNYTRIDPAAGGPTRPAGVQKGMITPYTPKWKWSGGIQYEIRIGEAGSLTPRVDAAYQGDMFANGVNTVRNQINAYTLVNARLTWRSPDRDWEAALEVTNLTDKLYYVTKFDQSGGAGFVQGQPGLPREWAMTVKRRF